MRCGKVFLKTSCLISHTCIYLQEKVICDVFKKSVTVQEEGKEKKSKCDETGDINKTLCNCYEFYL